MLFVTYWELNENMSEGERLVFIEKLESAGLFPPKDVEILRWDVTPDGWGILVVEAQTAADMVRSLDMWRMAEGGFFKSTRTAPAIPVDESIPLSEGLAKALG